MKNKKFFLSFIFLKLRINKKAIYKNKNRKQKKR